MKRLGETDVLSNEETALLHQCVEEIRNVTPEAEVILYGSRARGQAVADSDYDILVLIAGPVGLVEEDNIRQQLFPIELETGKVLTVNMFHKDDWNTELYKAMPFHQHVDADGIRL